MIKKFRWLLVLLGCFFVLGVLRINDLSLYTDSTRYLIWGHSLSEFRGYVDDTQPYPDTFVMNAPLYPLILAPVELAFPLSVIAAKLWTLLWGLVALATFFLWLRRHFHDEMALSLTALLALNPLFLTASTEILSEAPFIALLAVLLSTSDRFLENPGEKSTRLLFLISIGLITLLREVGAAFVVGALILFFRQKRGKDLLQVAFLAGGLLLLWFVRNLFAGSGQAEGQSSNIQYLFGHFVTSSQSSLATEFLTRVWLNFRGYAFNLGGRVLFPFPDALVADPSAIYLFLKSAIDGGQVVLFLICSGLGLLGVRHDLLSGPAGLFRLLSTAGYILIILIYPVHDIRFLLPLLPILFFYFGVAWKSLESWIGGQAFRQKVARGLVLLLIIPNAVAALEMVKTNISYTKDPAHFSSSLNPDDRAGSYFNKPWGLVGPWITSHIPMDAVIASPAKELAPFVYPRRVLETSRVLPPPVFERFLRDFDVRTLITVPAWDSVETYEFQMLESTRLWFDLTMQEAGIRLYSVHSTIFEPPPPQQSPGDTITTRGLMLKGRNALLDTRYEDALDFFARALKRESAQPEIAFQIFTALCFLGDSVGAMNMYQQLFTLPQSTAFTQNAAAVLSIMEQNLKARRLETSSQQSFAYFESGLGYWSLGYRHAALSTMRRVVRLDSTNFVGNLWGVYFAKELGDTLESNGFLDQLMRIDRNALIGKDWDDLRRMEAELGRTSSGAKIAALNLSIARAYAKIELFDKALDAIDRAMKQEPENIDLWLYKGEVLERKKARWGAAESYRKVLLLEPHNSFAKERLDTLSF